MKRRQVAPDFLALARVRRSLRALNNALTRGAEASGLTLQQQAFLLALAAYERKDVLLSDIREELEMDQATASEILAKLIAARLVVRGSAKDRRAANISFTTKGWAVFVNSLGSIRREMQRAEHRAELIALGPELDDYLHFYLGERRAPAGQRAPARQRAFKAPAVAQRSRPRPRRRRTSS
jgi:DNA-binding MarR family transcriptional regulator